MENSKEGENMALRIEGRSDRRATLKTVAADGVIESVAVRQKDAPSFDTQLGRTFHNAQEERLMQLAKEVEAQGKKLASRVDVGEMRAYRRLISSFIEEAVAGFGRFSKESFLDRRGRHRVYATVKTISERLEALAKEVVKAEKDNLAIAGHIEDIRGLVLDLLL